MNNSDAVPGISSDGSYQHAPANALFNAALLSSMGSKDSPVDSWSNAKIPFIEDFETAGRPDSDGWFDTALGTKLSYANYSSIIGLPVGRVPTGANSSFDVETSYWRTDCHLLDFLANGSVYGEYISTNSSYAAGLAISFASDTSNITSAGIPRENGSDPSILARQYNVSTTEDGGNTIATCSITTSYIAASLFCNDTACVVSRLRRSKLPHRPTNWTQLEFGSTERNGSLGPYFDNLCESIPGHDSFLSITSNYFVHPSNPFDLSNSPGPVYKVVPPAEFSKSLARLMNTFWLASIGDDVVPASREGAYAVYLDHFGGPLQAFEYRQFLNTTAHVTHTNPILVANHRWVSAFLVASFVGLASALGGLVFGILRRGPTLLMNISTTLRDTPFATIPEGGSALDDAERSRVLKRVQVMLGDVAPERELGHIAVATVGRDGEPVRPLQVRRMFD